MLTHETVVVVKEKGKVPTIHGTRRPYLTLSLAEPLVFERMYLRSLHQSINELMESDRAKGNAPLLQIAQGKLLKFKARFGNGIVSSTRGGNEQFEQWCSVSQVTEMKDKLGESITELHSFYSGIDAENQQRTLDILAVVLGFLGLAQLLIDLYEKEKPFVPTSIASSLLLCAFFFIYFSHH